jgi:hypothetical protein
LISFLSVPKMLLWQAWFYTGEVIGGQTTSAESSALGPNGLQMPSWRFG